MTTTNIIPLGIAIGRLSDGAHTAYQALVRCHEGPGLVTPEDTVWSDVYLDNARPAGWSSQKWAGHLSALKDAGLYWPVDDEFGAVRIE